MNRIHQIAISPKFNFYLLFPEGLLADFVSMIWASDGTPPFSQERIIPDGASVLIFNFGNTVLSEAQEVQKEFKKTLFAGIFSHFSDMNYLPNQQEHRQIGIIFKPAGSYPFIRKPIIEFKNLATETDVFDSKQFDEIHERLGNEVSAERRLFLLEKILFDLLKRNFEETIIPELITTIRVNPKMTIEELVRKTGYSQQHLNRILGKYAGINAKGFQKIFRIQAAMQAMQNSTIDLNLTDIAYQFNYFDQAHFIHDFKEMTGMTPKEYRMIQHPTSSRVIYL